MYPSNGYKTSLARRIASQYHIPPEQFNTFNYLKFLEYQKYLRSPNCKVERFLDSLEVHRQILLKREIFGQNTYSMTW